MKSAVPATIIPAVKTTETYFAEHFALQALSTNVVSFCSHRIGWYQFRGDMGWVNRSQERHTKRNQERDNHHRRRERRIERDTHSSGSHSPPSTRHSPRSRSIGDSSKDNKPRVRRCLLHPRGRPNHQAASPLLRRKRETPCRVSPTVKVPISRVRS